MQGLKKKHELIFINNETSKLELKKWNNFISKKLTYSKNVQLIQLLLNSVIHSCKNNTLIIIFKEPETKNL